MGWLYSHKPRGESATDYLIKRIDAEKRKNIVATAATLEAVFMVYRNHDPASAVYVPDADGHCRAIMVFKVNHVPRAKDGYTFGYKDMSEAMGPYGCEAPLRILDAASPLRELQANAPEYSSLRSATNYRARSRALAEQRAIKRNLEIGARVTLSSPLNFRGILRQHFTVERQRVRRRPGIITCFRADDGAVCLLKAADLLGATITPG